MSVENTLKAHTRTISDIAWHPIEPCNTNLFSPNDLI